MAYDVSPPGNEIAPANFYRHARTYHPVRMGDPEVLTLHADRALLLCWPPYSDEMAEQCLEHWSGDVLGYVGEGNGGCTATDDFHAALARDFVEVVRVDLPQWDGIHDDLTIFRRA